MEGNHGVGVIIHNAAHFAHHMAGDNRLHEVDPVWQHKIAVHALQRQAESVQPDQAQFVTGHFHQAAGEGLPGFLYGDGKHHAVNHVL